MIRISPQKSKNISLGFAIIAAAIVLGNCCKDDEWSCGTGECIDTEKVCDGKVDCPDGTDESTDTCINQICPPFSLRCAYGACVPSAARCDGKNQCADNSDELMCVYPSGNNTICANTEFQCKSGDCIIEENACDGQPDCQDKSDETVEACEITVCPELFFRCGYGACIKIDRKCDDVNDCVDGSDEAQCESNELSDKPKKTPVVTPAPPLTNTSQPTSGVKTTCTAPNVKDSRLSYEEDSSRIIRPGDEVPAYTSIAYACMPGFNLEGPRYNLCFNGAWFSKTHPVCIRYCPHDSLVGVTFNVRCIRDGGTVPCNDRIKPGTVARVSCPPKYRIPDRNPIQSLYCEEDGQWDYPPSRCEPICGEELIPSVPFLVNGQVTNITSVPWHVGIYRRFGDKYKHNCGGSIINAKIIISAAHCFWDFANAIVYNKSFFIVGAGKVFRDYYMDESRKGQFQNISQIVIPSEFKGEDEKFRADIAVVVLSYPLKFSEFVAPICIEWQMDGRKSITNNLYGQIAGWGKDESGEFSSELKTIYVPANNYETCVNSIEPRYADSLTVDKFCVVNKYETNACQGDSGGGFAVKREIDGKSKYFLWGVVSNGVPNGLTCSNFQFVSYTNIQYYETFVTSLEARNRPK